MDLSYSNTFKKKEVFMSCVQKTNINGVPFLEFVVYYYYQRPSNTTKKKRR